MARQKDFLTDQQVEAEISRLNSSDSVQLARLEQRIRYRHRQYLYTLRNLEKRGQELKRQGFDTNNLEAAIERGEII